MVEIVELCKLACDYGFAAGRLRVVYVLSKNIAWWQYNSITEVAKLCKLTNWA